MSTADAFQLLAIDPGTVKCGLGVLDAEGNVLFREISSTQSIQGRLIELIDQWNINQVVYGQSTGATNIRELLEGLHTKSIFTLHGIDEKNSTLEARPLYWQENPRRGLLRLIPISLLSPPVPIDDFAAVILGRRFLETR